MLIAIRDFRPIPTLLGIFVKVPAVEYFLNQRIIRRRMSALSTKSEIWYFNWPTLVGR